MRSRLCHYAPLLLLGASLPLPGCTLIDQTTFYPPARRVTVAAPPPAPALQPNGALLTVSLAGGVPDYQSSLAGAVAQALAAKPNIVFQVVSLIPQHGDTAPSWEQAQAVTVWGRRIADQIQQDGVDPGQVELGLRAMPGLDHGEIRVYVQ